MQKTTRQERGERALTEVVTLLQSAESTDTGVRSRAETRLAALRAQPEFNQCLAYTFSNPRVDVDLRARAGNTLLRNLGDQEMYMSMPMRVRDTTKHTILTSMGDPNPKLRDVVGQLLARVAAIERLEGWGGLIGMLVRYLDSKNSSVCAGAMAVTGALCCECRELLIKRLPKELDSMVDKLTALVGHSNKDMRKHAVDALRRFLKPDGLCPAIQTHAHSVVKALVGAVARKDEQSVVTLAVVRALHTLQKAGSRAIRANFRGVVTAIVGLSANTDPTVAHSVAEFIATLTNPRNKSRLAWFSTDDAGQRSVVLADLLSPHLGKLVDKFLAQMQYSEMEIKRLGTSDDDCHTPDAATGIAPRRSVQQTEQEKATSPAASAQVQKSAPADTGTQQKPTQHSLRQASAHCLDNLTHIMEPGVVLGLLMPTVGSLSKDENWVCRESATLALGTVARSGSRGIAAYLGDTTAVLVGLATDKSAFVRRMACWTISRYSRHLIQAPPSPTDTTGAVKPDEAKAKREAALLGVVDAVLERMLDSNKKVRKAACGALYSMYSAPAASAAMAPFSDKVLAQLVACATRYQESNLHTLYDCVAAVARGSPALLSRPEFLQALVPKMLEKWSKMKSTDYGLFPLLESLASVAQAAGSAFQPLAKVIFPQCVKLIQMNLQAMKKGGQGSAAAPAAGSAEAKTEADEKQATSTQSAPDTNTSADTAAAPAPAAADSGSTAAEGSVYEQFDGQGSIVCCIGLAGSLYRAMGPQLALSLVDPVVLLRIMTECVVSQLARVRQCAMALVGDVICVTPKFLGMFSQQLLPAMIGNLDPRNPNLCSNAAWAVGEAAIRMSRRAFSPYVDVVMRKLIPVIVDWRLDRNLLHNAAITISRLGLVCPDEVAVHLNHFARQWCFHLVGIDMEREAEMAYRGLCNVVSKRPQAMLSPSRTGPAFANMCDAIAAYENPSKELHRAMHSLLHGFKHMLHQRWNQLYMCCNPELRFHLGRMYDLRLA